MKALVSHCCGECNRANALKSYIGIYGKIKAFEFPSLMGKMHNITYRGRAIRVGNSAFNSQIFLTPSDQIIKYLMPSIPLCFND